MRYLFIFIFLIFNPSWSKAPTRSKDFPVKGVMRTQVDFWKRVYTEIGSSEAFIHDSEDLSIIYKKIELKASRRDRSRQIKEEKGKIKNLLLSLRNKNFKNLNNDEEQLYKIIGNKSKNDIKAMEINIRTQSGLRDMYYAGLKRSYAYLYYIEETFKKFNLPHELTYLPHVESSFNYHAYSKVGAAGIWQFMRATARLYGLKVNYIIDERRDPIKATIAAARFLKDNYRTLETWPLALTAYNHGARSVKRAVKSVQSTDINEIIENYDGRRFGFASKNFYATFMATVEISEEPEKYFKDFTPPKPYIFSTVTLDRAYTPKALIANTQLTIDLLKEYNPSIRSTVYKSNLAIPKGFNLRIPKTSEDKVKNFLANIKKIKLKKYSYDDEKVYIISRGETLYDISRIFKVNLNDLIAYNQIENPSRIYAGMKLKIPTKKSQIKQEVKNIELATKIEPEVTKVAPKKEIPSTKKEEVKLKAEKEFLPEVNLADYNLDIKEVSEDIYLLTIETEETLGHYAEWSKTKTQSIRNLNKFSFKRNIKLGDQIKVRIPDIGEFKQERAKHHLLMQEDFYDNFKVEPESSIYKVKKGDNLTEIIHDNNIPFWLLRKYQKNKLKNDQLFVGQKINIPKVTSNEDN